MTSIRQLEYFVAVVDQSSFTKAAAQLTVSQPGLSHQITALERSLRGVLLSRSTNGPRLTALGRAVLPLARAAVADMARIRQIAAEVMAGAAGTLHVATISSLSIAVLPRILRAWRTEHPGVTVVVTEHTQVEHVLNSLNVGTADIALTPLPDDWAGSKRLVGVEEFVVAVSSDHRLADEGRKQVRFAELREEAWVQFDDHHGLAGVLTFVAAQAGFSPRVAMRTGQTGAASAYAEAGVGATLIPANLLPRGFSGHALRLDPPITRQIFLVLPNASDALATSFAATVVHSADLRGDHIMPL